MEDGFDWIREVEIEPMIDYPETWKGVKMGRDDERRFRYLTYKYPCLSFAMGGNMHTLRETIMHGEMYGRTAPKETYDKLEIYEIGAKYCMNEHEVWDLWYKNYIKKSLYIIKTDTMPKIVKRDNKGTYNEGSGYGNRNKIRYPKKNRSRRTWRNFYKLFPWLAEKDGWDGKTSKRMR
jgi:hypothetical protein